MANISSILIRPEQYQEYRFFENQYKDHIQTPPTVPKAELLHAWDVTIDQILFTYYRISTLAFLNSFEWKQAISIDR